MNQDGLFTPWLPVEWLAPACRGELRRRAIFECCKWDPQVEDVSTLAPMALVLRRSAWEDLRRMAEALAAETLALERALLRRPDLHRRLAIPRPVRGALADVRGENEPCASGVRVMRFDFHPTDEGWRVSEVNSDVPGGYNEAAGWTRLVAEHVSQGVPAADPVERLADAIAEAAAPGATVALVHATAYSDDRQVMTFLARRLQHRGYRPVLLAPDHLVWSDGCASVRTEWFTGRADFIFRFFPAEWLPNLGRRAEWRPFFRPGGSPQCNPGSALLTQSKRWPLVLGRLGLELPTWSRLLPETRDPTEVDWEGESGWVLKPALGRVGESIGMPGLTDAREWKAIRRAARWRSGHWVAQRRFVPVPVQADGVAWHVCVGVYTVNGRAAGIYGRAAPQPLINHLACDLAILVEQNPSADCALSKSYESIRAV